MSVISESTRHKTGNVVSLEIDNNKTNDTTIVCQFIHKSYWIPIMLIL